MKTISKIIFIYSTCVEDIRFIFNSKYIKFMMITFLKEKNADIRNFFSLAMRSHF